MFVREIFDVSSQVRIDQVLFFGERCVFGPGFIHVSFFSLNSWQSDRLFFSLRLNFEFISFNFNEHFLFHGQVVLFAKFIILFVVLILERVKFFDIFIEFLFVFLHSLMMHFMEVPFFEELVVSGLGLLRESKRVIKLLLQLLGLVFEDLCLNGSIRDIIRSILVVVIPFLLEGLKSFVHLVRNKKVTNKIVNHFQSLDMFGHKELGLLLLKLSLFQTRQPPSGVFFNRGVDKIIKLVHIIDTFIDKVEIVEIVERLSDIGVATHFNLLDDINVLLFVGHVCLFRSVLR